MDLFDREKLEKKEQNNLATYAAKSSLSKGRNYIENEDELRLPYQIDRDRIIHSRSFRRLKGKTQVFVSNFGDHYRTRLTHTLEVAQLSRDIARNLGLNEDLAESIALAHDLGHTPFGHAGEEALNEMMKGFDSSFEHNKQSRRIVEFLEKGYPSFDGLNLSYEVLEGLIKHQSFYDNKNEKVCSIALESEVVDLADEITYQIHDLDDGYRSGILTIDQLQGVALFDLAIERINKKYKKEVNIEIYFERVLSGIFKILVEDAIINSMNNIKENKLTEYDQIKDFSDKFVQLSENIKKLNIELKNFLMNNFYLHEKVSRQSKKGQKVIKSLFYCFLDKDESLPRESIELINNVGEKKEIVITDYISGMTDSFAMEEIERLSLKQE